MDRALHRPAVLVAPLVVAHHKNANRLLALHSVVDSFYVMVHPTKNDFVVVHFRRGTKVDIAGCRLFEFAVRPRADNRLRARIFFAFARSEQSVEIRRCAVWPVRFVIPAGNIQHGAMNAIVFSAQLRPVPPRIGRRMRQPFVIKRRHIFEIGQIAERKEILQPLVFCFPRGRRFFIGLRPRQIFLGANIRRDVEPDPIDPRAIENAARIEKIARRGKRHRRNHRLQMRRTLDRRKPLHRPGIRKPERSHVAVRPWLRGGPLDRVVSVTRLVDERIPDALGREPPAGVLNDDQVALRRKVVCLAEISSEIV